MQPVLRRRPVHSLNNETGGAVNARTGGALGGLSAVRETTRGPAWPSGEARGGCARGREGVHLWTEIWQVRLGALFTTLFGGAQRMFKRLRCASRVAGGCARLLGQGAGPTRIAQGRRVGGGAELSPSPLSTQTRSYSAPHHGAHSQPLILRADPQSRQPRLKTCSGRAVRRVESSQA